MMRRFHSTANFLLAGLALAIAGGLAACGETSERRATTVETVTGLQVETVRMTAVPDEVEAPGVVRSATTADVAARTMGTVLQVSVKEGDAVRRGQLLVQLDEREMAARRIAAESGLREAGAAQQAATQDVSAAEAQADLAQKTYQRYVYLRDQKSVSPQEFDEAASRQSAAAAALASARAQKERADAAVARVQAELGAVEIAAGYARIVAPFDGVVLRRHIDPGAMASPGVPLLTLEDSSRYRLEVDIDASAARNVRRGTTARVQIDSLPSRILSGTVSELEAGADTQTQTLRVRLDLPRDAALRSGLFGRAWFARGERQALAIARTSIVERGQLRGVYVVDAENIARWRLVTLGPAVGEQVEVLSGLNAGQRIVLAPGSRDLEGKRIAVATSEARP